MVLLILSLSLSLSLSLFIIFLSLHCLSLFIRFISIFQLALDCHGDVDDGDRPPSANSRGRRRFFRAAAAWLPPVRRARQRAFLVCPHGGGSSCSALRRFVSSLGYVEELTFLRPNRRTEGASRHFIVYHFLCSPGFLNFPLNRTQYTAEEETGRRPWASASIVPLAT